MLHPQAAALAKQLMSDDEESPPETRGADGLDLPELPEGFAYSGRRKVVTAKKSENVHESWYHANLL